MSYNASDFMGVLAEASCNEVDRETRTRPTLSVVDGPSKFPVNMQKGLLVFERITSATVRSRAPSFAATDVESTNWPASNLT